MLKPGCDQKGEAKWEGKKEELQSGRKERRMSASIEAAGAARYRDRERNTYDPRTDPGTEK